MQNYKKKVNAVVSYSQNMNPYSTTLLNSHAGDELMLQT